jgi:hypothetical protein
VLADPVKLLFLVIDILLVVKLAVAMKQKPTYNLFRVPNRLNDETTVCIDVNNYVLLLVSWAILDVANQLIGRVGPVEGDDGSNSD